jgi:type I restriction enzyme M protein
MANITKALIERYNYLTEVFQNNEFRFNEVNLKLKEKFTDSDSYIKVFLSELNKAGYLKIKSDKKDKREKIYSLIGIADITPDKKLSRAELNSILKSAADIIRTRVDYTFILLLLFYKRISDKYANDYDRKFEELKKGGWIVEDAKSEAKNPVYYDFIIPEKYLWDNIRKDTLKLSENLSLAMKELADLNPDLKEIFTQFDFLDFTRSRENNEILRQLFELFSRCSFENASPDVLGDAYEFILKYFAPSKAKEGEVYTNRNIIRLMAKLLDIQPEETVYDGSCGSAGMLIIAYQNVRDRFSVDKANTLRLYGQEQNFKTLALAKMNIVIHGIRNAKLEQGDTLLYPKFKEAGKGIMTFDKTIVNPPWNQKGYDEESLKKGEFWQKRYEYGLTTKQSADWVWVEHFIASTKKKAAIVLDTGAMTRGNREKEIKKNIVDKDLVEAIILLPEKLFYNTGAPGIILVINKEKSKKQKNKILLINASKEFEPGKPQNDLGVGNIESISRAYEDFSDKEKLAKVIDTEAIIEADYNLSPSRFISVDEEKNLRNIDDIYADLTNLKKEEEKHWNELKPIIEKIK